LGTTGLFTSDPAALAGGTGQRSEADLLAPVPAASAGATGDLRSALWHGRETGHNEDTVAVDPGLYKRARLVLAGIK
jgi:hypothetical protein